MRSAVSRTPRSLGFPQSAISKGLSSVPLTKIIKESTSIAELST